MRPGNLRRSGGIRCRSERGVVLVQALIVLAGLVALLSTLAANQFAVLTAQQNQLRRRRDEIAVNAAIQRALCVLQTATPNLVTLNDSWALLGDNGNSSFDLGNGSTFRMQIVDTASLINVNTATTAQLDSLPLTQQEIDSLLDWISTGTQPRTDGAKDSYYNNLSTPYNTKLGPITTLSELLLIQGWTGLDLYSTQNSNAVISSTGPLVDANGNPLPLIAILTADSGMPNQSATGTTLLNLNVRGGVTAQRLERIGISQTLAAALAGKQFTSWAALLATSGVTTVTAQTLLNNVTISTASRVQGIINLNTATQAVLQTVPNITQTMATSIVAQQTTSLQTLGALTSVSGVSVRQLGQIAGEVGVGSDTFLVRIYAESGGVGEAYEVTVGLRASAASTTAATTTGGTTSTLAPQIVAVNRMPGAAIPSYWSWTPQTNQTLDPGDASQESNTSSGSTTPGAGGTP